MMKVVLGKTTNHVMPFGLLNLTPNVNRSQEVHGTRARGSSLPTWVDSEIRRCSHTLYFSAVRVGSAGHSSNSWNHFRTDESNSTYNNHLDNIFDDLDKTHRHCRRSRRHRCRCPHPYRNRARNHTDTTGVHSRRRSRYDKPGVRPLFV